MDMKLAGRTILVTGASSGVGLATARMLLAEQANVAACARDGERLRDALASDDPAESERLHLLPCDVTDRVAVDALVTSTVAQFGGIDGVVCNAGQSLMASVEETSDEQIRQELDLKIFGALNVIQAAQPHLSRSDAGSVVVVNAILARQPEPRLAITSAARAALLNLTKTLSVGLGCDGTRINSVLLGLIDTGQWRRRYEAGSTTQSYEEWVGDVAADRGIVLGRFGTADEVAFPILSLLSPLSGYVTGASLDIGGGVARYQ